MDGEGGDLAPSGRWLDEAARRAREVVAPSVWRYVEEGADEEISLREAASAWRSLRVVPRVLRDVRRVDPSTTLLGVPASLPVGIAPMTLQRAADPDGEVATARAAADAGVPLVLSSNAGSTFAEVAATGCTWWLQLYLTPDRDDSRPLVESATEAGASAVVLTLDTPVVARRRADPRVAPVWADVDPRWLGANHADPLGPAPADRPKAMDLAARDLALLGEWSGLPVVVKGVLDAEDATACVSAGARAVWVSNHGGRQLDRTPPTAHCLPAVVAAVRGLPRDPDLPRPEVYVDGGVRSGLDVMLATALGADAAFVGRPVLHALAAGGVEGVVRALGELGEELVEAMRLSGCSGVADTARLRTNRQS